jgi:hypothetical protein
MLAHCGIPWEQSVLSFHQTQRTVSTASLAQVGAELAGRNGQAAWGMHYHRCSASTCHLLMA